MSQLRLLITPRILNIRMNATPTVVITNEPQARSINQLNFVPADFRANGDIDHGVGLVNNHEQFMSICFENMQLRNIQRADRKGAESVTEEKFALLFQTEIVIDNEIFNIWKLSLPIVVIVHGSQELQAWATIFWDNYFGSMNREPFVVPESVPWSKLAEALNTFFTMRMERAEDKLAGGKPLNPENLLCFAEKLNVNGDDQLVHWSMLSRNELRNRNFSFWKWFFEALKLLSSDTNLREAWQRNTIMGFIARELAQTYLINREDGTFLLRFSDSTLGEISI